MIPTVWVQVIEQVFQHIVSQVLAFDTENKIPASVNHIKISPKNTDWMDKYKKDRDLSFLFNHATIKATPIFLEISNAVDRCYRTYLREDRIRFLNGKLLCYIPIGEENRCVCVFS